MRVLLLGLLACTPVLAAADRTPRPLPPDVPVTRTAPACPSWLTIWTMTGGLESGDGWTADLLEIRGDRARITHLVLFARTPRLPAAEMDWFLSETPRPEIEAFSTSMRALSGKPLSALCTALSRDGIDAVLHRASATLISNRGEFTIENHDAVAVMSDPSARTGVEIRPPDPRPVERLPSIPWEEGYKAPPGTIVQPGIEATQTRTTDRRDVTEKELEPFEEIDRTHAHQDEAERQALENAREIVVRAARTLTVRRGDLADVPMARRTLARIGELDATGLPENLPTEFRLAAAGAPADYVKALAIETLTHEDSPDRLLALRILGDDPSPDAIEDLLILLARRPETKVIQQDNALALRALLKAAPDTARLIALRMLSGPKRTVRAAMGVFFFTEPALRRELASLDFSNPAKVVGMTARIRGHLAASARDPELKRMAASLAGS